MSYRTFLDRAGRRWEVWKVTPSAAERRRTDRRAVAGSSDAFQGSANRRVTPERRRNPFRRSVAIAPEFNGGWLCFESDGEKRRLVPVPKGWERGGPEKLLTWLQTARRVGK